MYEKIYDERITFDKKDPRNYIFKIVLNSTYGLSKESNNFLYDPLYTFTTTVNGELTILMLTEMVCEYVKDCELIQINTDGITIRYKREYRDRVNKILSKFEDATNQVVETAFYSKFILRDVNNYISVFSEGGAKYKGAFELELDFHKNASAMIVPIAVSKYFLEDIPVEETIKNHTNIYDFCLGIKKQSSFDLNLYLADGAILTKKEMQKVTRVYASKKGGFLFKDFHDGRRIGVLAGVKVLEANIITEEDALKHDIDYSYYITRCIELIDSVEGSGKLFKKQK